MHFVAAFAVLLQAASAAQPTTVKIESNLELDIVVRDGSAAGESTKLLNLLRRETYKQRQVDDRTYQLQCVSSMLQRSGTDMPLEDKPTPLSGNAYTAVRGASGWIVEDPSGGAAPAEGQYLGAWNDIGRLIPAGEAPAVGAKWTVDGKDLLALISPAALREGTGAVECTCESKDGAKIQVVFTGAVKGKGREDLSMQLALMITSGRLVYDTAGKTPSSLMMTGSIEAVTDMVERVRKPGSLEEEVRKIGEITVRSRKLEAFFQFE